MFCLIGGGAALKTEGVKKKAAVLHAAVSVNSVDGDGPCLTDGKFPYGYGKWEGLATMWISVCLVGGAGGMMWHFGEKMFPALAVYLGSSRDDDEPVSLMSVHAISVAVASILLKEVGAGGVCVHSLVTLKPPHSYINPA